MKLLLTVFYRSTIKNILTTHITVWYIDTTGMDHNALKRVVQSAECTTAEHLADLQDIYFHDVKRRQGGQLRTLAILTTACCHSCAQANATTT
ncbi:hypothetical protein QTP86_006893 [Hemibagrus guttatus]|nr:hypothetical protein QTP86_006893 [Hemibagrus guttatus]